MAKNIEKLVEEISRTKKGEIVIPQEVYALLEVISEFYESAGLNYNGRTKPKPTMPETESRRYTKKAYD